MLKLYRVNLVGMRNRSSGTEYGSSYVIAEDAGKAYYTLKQYLEREEIGFSGDRALKSVELIAECTNYPECRTMLLFAETRESGLLPKGEDYE